MKVFVLTGAGIAAESGIPTFRGINGLWKGHRVEDVATPAAFTKNPELVHEFYNERRRQFLQKNIQPNAAHFALAEFEKTHADDFLLVTQNIDPLHRRQQECTSDARAIAGGQVHGDRKSRSLDE